MLGVQLSTVFLLLAQALGTASNSPRSKPTSSSVGVSAAFADSEPPTVNFISNNGTWSISKATVNVSEPINVPGNLIIEESELIFSKLNASINIHGDLTLIGESQIILVNFPRESQSITLLEYHSYDSSRGNIKIDQQNEFTCGFHIKTTFGALSLVVKLFPIGSTRCSGFGTVLLASLFSTIGTVALVFFLFPVREWVIILYLNAMDISNSLSRLVRLFRRPALAPYQPVANSQQSLASDPAQLV